VGHQGYALARGAALACALAACGTGPPPAPTRGATTASSAAPAVVEAPTPPPTIPREILCAPSVYPIGKSDPVLARQIDARALPPAGLGSRVLYAWVSPSQADVMRRARVLLDRRRLPGGEPFAFDRQRMARPSAIGALFDRPSLSKRLLAWPNAWGLIADGSRRARPFRDVPVRVTLRPNAWMASLDAGGAWRFSDLEGSPVAEADVARDPDRLAAAYHAPLDRPREVLLCNEAMIEEWALSTEEIHAEIQVSLDLLRRLAAAVDPGPTVRPPPGAEGACGTSVKWAYDDELTRAFVASVSGVRIDGLFYMTVGDLVTALADLPPGGAPFRQRPAAPILRGP
jgi:hypothetical protein